MSNPIKDLTKKEWGLWLTSLLIIAVSDIISGDIDFLTLTAAWIGITSLIFAAKGNVWSQVLMIVFSILYGIISWRFRYWGEMITYLGMTMPMAIWSMITWIKNPAKNGKEVAIQRLNKKHIIGIVFFGTIITVPLAIRSDILFQFLNSLFLLFCFNADIPHLSAFTFHFNTIIFNLKRS